ncbi:MAG: dihydrolipoamide acetyltransferase family protein [Anaerolineales bacterium]|jgi:pyruvate dehydrogenase E2 component (dihydrolipoamide acetyltransferase)
MSTEILMPKLGLNMTEGKLVQWLKREGDRVERGDLLMVVETDKITMEAESQTSGILDRIIVPAGRTVPVATVVGIIVGEGEAPAEIRLSEGTVRQTEGSPARLASQSLKSPAGEAGSGRGVPASPIAKRIAHDHGLDLSTLKGTGQGGRITQQDVENALATKGLPAVVPGGGQDMPMDAVRALVAQRMMRSVLGTAQVTLHAEVDVGRLLAFRERLKGEAESLGRQPPGLTAILTAITARALREHLYMNSTEANGLIHVSQEIHIGQAVDTERGLLVVVVRNADQKSIQDTAEELAALRQRAQEGKSKPEDLGGSTFTLTNLGMYDVDGFTPILNPPEAGILGVGRIVEKVAWRGGQVVAQPMMTLSLTFDHRLVDGAPAARFLQFVKVAIEQLEE